MVKTKTKNTTIAKLTPLIAGAVIVVSGIIAPVVSVRADQFDEQIRQKQAEQQYAQSKSSTLSNKANTIEGKIEKLQIQIANIQTQINANEKRQTDLSRQIQEAQDRLEEQKDLLGANIRSMYIEGDISPLEMLASSKNLSDFVDKQEYRDRIKENITNTLDEIEKLKKQLDVQKLEVTKILEEQKSLKGSLNSKERDANSKLAQVNQTKASFDKEVNLKAQEIASLRAQQLAANARFFGGAPGTGAACGGGYPGRWCNIAKDSVADDWGMYNRECVSYTAFKVASSGRNMPGWGFSYSANANDWPGLADMDKIPRSSTPKAGDVAISYGGTWGHAMYVEAVYGDGTIFISQYNADLTGTYSTARISSQGLTFIHFR